MLIIRAHVTELVNKVIQLDLQHKFSAVNVMIKLH